MSKTLTLAPKKTSIAVLFVFVFLFSCQKDALYTPSIKQQLIKKEEITALFNQMPISNLLTPNWEEALQTNMNGSAVVRMPIKNVDRLKEFVPAGLDLELKTQANGKQMSLKTGSTNSQTSTNGANPNASPDQCYDKVVEIIQQVRTAIQNNPTTHINQLVF